MKIQADNPAVEKAIRAMETIMVDNGAWFHPQFCIVSDGGDLWGEIHGPMNPDTLYIKSPQFLFVPKDAMNWSVKGDTFYDDPDPERMSPVQIEIGKYMTEVFNLTGKAAFHRSECPWIKFKHHPELLMMLCGLRTPNAYTQDKLSYLQGKADSLNDDDFMCFSFFASRVLGMQKVGEKNIKTQVIMPIIDYVNHDGSGGPYIVRDKGEDVKEGYGTMYIHNRQPHHTIRQCFVKYGFYDTVDTYLNYGFPDLNAGFVRSIAMSFEVEGYGLIHVKTMASAQLKKEMPKQLSDIRQFVPAVAKKPDGTMDISFLSIPLHPMPHALRRILQVVIRTFVGPKESRDFVIKNVFLAEKKILKTNIEHYEGILSNLEGIEAPEDLKKDIRTIASVQLNKLHKYAYMDNFFAPTTGTGNEENNFEIESVEKIESEE